MAFLSKTIGWIFVLLGVATVGAGVFLYVTRKPQIMTCIEHAQTLGKQGETEQRKAAEMLDVLVAHPGIAGDLLKMEAGQRRQRLHVAMRDPAFFLVESDRAAARKAAESNLMGRP